MIALKTAAEIGVVAENARLLGGILVGVALRARPGVATDELDAWAESQIRDAGAEPAFKGYHGYPATLCVSVNEEIVHGIPSARKLRDGDIVSLDLGLRRAGYYADAALTVGVGRISPEAERLLAVTRGALQEAIRAARLGGHVSDLSHAIGRYVDRHGFHVVREFVGHGIGRDLHEDPQIPSFGVAGQGTVLREGMVLCPEPMVKGDDLPVRILEDGWTAVTASGSLAAHYEEMVVVTADGPWVLTGGIWEAFCRRRT
ncbi:MAG: Methionine aminopeptidase [Candidatus Bipolaricaulis sibiricus]|uniref:Methionine aminopeptidase n=1 Tax=Bipolaricaulis sibiricus TaxID=2501609 RepID=A0A410FTN3_BIPS1|nr:MAG: Methionine aminopeptidase [Candidatus Bipolaricaulis sibiricus]